jgi:hypothetical protein
VRGAEEAVEEGALDVEEVGVGCWWRRRERSELAAGKGAREEGERQK